MIGATVAAAPPAGPYALLITDNAGDEAQIRHVFSKYRIGNAIHPIRDLDTAITFLAPPARPPEFLLIALASEAALAPFLGRLRAATGGEGLPCIVLSAQGQAAGFPVAGEKACFAIGRPVGFFKLLEAMQKLGIYWMAHRQSPGGA